MKRLWGLRELRPVVVPDIMSGEQQQQHHFLCETALAACNFRLLWHKEKG